MNLRMVAKYLGFLLLAEAAFMLAPAIVCLIYGETQDLLPVLASAGICALPGVALVLAGGRKKAPIYAREGFVIAGVGWVLVSFFGAFPFYLSNHIPSLPNAVLESVAGFTTTGTFLTNSMESWGRGLLFWRNFAQWLGGIGVLAFILAIVREKAGGGVAALNMYRAESPGPVVGKTAPKTQTGIRHIFYIYFGLSALNLLFLLLGGMPLYEALCIMFGTAGTGGYGTTNGSLAAFSPYLQGVTTVFMLLFGVNFTLYVALLRGQWRQVLKNEELRLYGGVVLGSVALITAILALSGTGGLWGSLHHAAFKVSSVITSTGYSIGSYAVWPGICRALLFLLMVVGAMGGSTAGGFKMVRLLILLKTLRAGLFRMLHPRSVTTVRMNGKPVEPELVTRIQLFLFVYCAVVLLSFTLISVDGLPLATNLSAVLACISNVGPGFGLVAEVVSFDDYSTFSRFVLAFNMLLGRLEVFPILMLFFPSTWRRKA